MEDLKTAAAIIGSAVAIGKPVVETGCKLIENLLGEPCKVAGAMLADQVYAWQWENRIKIAHRAKVLLDQNSVAEKVLPPGFLIPLLDKTGNVNQPELQEMWAGLLASSCSNDETDETNLIFMNLLSQLSSSQAKIISLPFIEGQYSPYQYDDMEYTTIEKERSELINYAGLSNWGILRRELEHLDSLGLVAAGDTIGSNPQASYVELRYEEAAFRLYMRCQGYTGKLHDFLSNQLKINTTE
jgi:hypothetical protein